MTLLAIVCLLTRRHKWQSINLEPGADLQCLRCPERRRPFS